MDHSVRHPRIVRDVPSTSRERSDRSQSLSSHASSCSTCFGRPPVDDADVFLRIRRIVRRSGMSNTMVWNAEVLVECTFDGEEYVDERSYTVVREFRGRRRTPNGVEEVFHWKYMVDQSLWDRDVRIDVYRQRLSRRVYFTCPQEFVRMFKEKLPLFDRSVDLWMNPYAWRRLCGESMEFPPIMWGNCELREVRACPPFMGTVDTVLVTLRRVNLDRMEVRRIRKFTSDHEPGRSYYFEQTICRDETVPEGSFTLCNGEFLRFLQPYFPQGF